MPETIIPLQQNMKVFAALARAQAIIGPVEKDKTATVQTKGGGEYTYKYTSLPTLIEAIRKPNAEEKLSLTFDTIHVGNGWHVIGTVTHDSGECVECRVPIPTCHDMQALGSAKTYARRYIIQDLYNIAGDDDDDAEQAKRGSMPNQRHGNNQRQTNTQGQGKAIGGGAEQRQGGPDLINPGQAKALFALAERYKITGEQVREIIKGMYGVDTTKALSVKQYGELTKLMGARPVDEIFVVVAERQAERELSALEKAQASQEIPS